VIRQPNQAEIWDDLPRVFTNEFKAMLRVWGALSVVLHFGHDNKTATVLLPLKK
jgi:hypothetical protein